MNSVFNKQNSKDIVLEFLLIYKKHLILFFFFIIMFIGGYFIWNWRLDSINQEATIDLQKILTVKKTAVSSASDDLKNEVLVDLDNLFIKHKSSSLAPYFLLLKASALENKKEFKEEVDVLALAEDLIKDESVKSLIKIKKLSTSLLVGEYLSGAILELDSISQTNNDLIKQLSSKVLFNYFWNEKEFSKSKIYGERLVKLQESLSLDLNNNFLKEVFEKYSLITVF